MESLFPARPCGTLRVPDFAACNTCGADAGKYVVWDQGDGWTCLNCFATDGGD